MSLQIRTHSFNPVAWLLTLGMGVLLVVLAIPGLMTLYAAYPVTGMARDFPLAVKGAKLADMEMAAQRLERASKIEPGRRRLRKAQVTLLLRLHYKLRSAERSDDARNILQQAGVAIASSLRRAPGDANLWYLLAEIRALRGKMNGEALRFLKMSYLSGPREGWIALRRLQFSLRYWLLLDGNLRRFVKKEIATLWADPSYRGSLLRQFSGSGSRAQGVIYDVIKARGNEEVKILEKQARRAGWKLIF